MKHLMPPISPLIKSLIGPKQPTSLVEGLGVEEVTVFFGQETYKPPEPGRPGVVEGRDWSLSLEPSDPQYGKLCFGEDPCWSRELLLVFGFPGFGFRV